MTRSLFLFLYLSTSAGERARIHTVVSVQFKIGHSCFKRR